MQVQLDSAILGEALSVISKMSPPDSGNIVFRVTDRIRLISVGQTNNCEVALPGKPNGKADFAVPIEALKSAIKGHGTIEAKYENTVLHLKSGRTQLKLSTVDAVQIDGDKVEYDQTLKMDAKTVSSFKDALTAVALKPNALISAFMPCGVKLTPKGTFVACFDSSRMSFTSTKEVKGDAEFVLPFDILLLVLTSFSKTGMVMRINKASVEISNDLVTVNMAIPNLDQDLPTLADCLGQSKAAKESKGTQLKFDKKTLVTFLENCRGVMTKERSELRGEAVEGKFKMSVVTTQGEADTSFKSKTKVGTKFLMDLEYFDELVRKSDEQVEFLLVDDAYVQAKTSNATIMMSLNQDG